MSVCGQKNLTAKLRNDLVPEKELESVKNYLSGTEAIEMQDQTELAQRLAMSQLYGEGAAHVFGRRARLAKVTSADVKAAAFNYLSPEKFAQAILKPE